MPTSKTQGQKQHKERICSTERRCASNTRKNILCRRCGKAPGTRCWQHKSKASAAERPKSRAKSGSRSKSKKTSKSGTKSKSKSSRSKSSRTKEWRPFAGLNISLDEIKNESSKALYDLLLILYARGGGWKTIALACDSRDKPHEHMHTVLQHKDMKKFMNDDCEVREAAKKFELLLHRESETGSSENEAHESNDDTTWYPFDTDPITFLTQNHSKPDQSLYNIIFEMYQIPFMRCYAEQLSTAQPENRDAILESIPDETITRAFKTSPTLYNLFNELLDEDADDCDCGNVDGCELCSCPNCNKVGSTCNCEDKCGDDCEDGSDSWEDCDD